MRDAGGNGIRRRHRTWAVAVPATVACLILLSSSLAHAGQPPLFQPEKHFYNAQGQGVRARWTAAGWPGIPDRIAVPLDGNLLVTLTITKVTNPRDVVRPNLHELPAFRERFTLIEEVPGPPLPPGTTEVGFTYRLRPRNREVDRLPSLEFYYLNPNAEGKARYPKTVASGIDLVVTAARPKAKLPPPPPVPLEAPEHLFAVTVGPEVLDRGPFTAGWPAWLVCLAAGPVLAIGWYAVWRRVYPDAARLARLRRGRAARRALDTIRQAARRSEPAGMIAVAVLGYLQARFPLPTGTTTPTEVGEGLVTAGLPETAAVAVADFLRRCDAARFAPPDESRTSLAADAASLIARLEAAE